MGCIICNILIQDPLTEGGTNNQQVDELKEEMCNDIAIHHSEMVIRINEIRADHMMHVREEYVDKEL